MKNINTIENNIEILLHIWKETGFKVNIYKTTYMTDTKPKSTIKSYYTETTSEPARNHSATQVEERHAPASTHPCTFELVAWSTCQQPIHIPTSQYHPKKLVISCCEASLYVMCQPLLLYCTLCHVTS
jgi:hypothetical protein